MRGTRGGLEIDPEVASVFGRMLDLAAGCALFARHIDRCRQLLTQAIDIAPFDGQRAHLMQQARALSDKHYPFRKVECLWPTARLAPGTPPAALRPS